MSLAQVPTPDLESLAEQVHHHHSQARHHAAEAVEHYLAVGRCLRDGH